MERTRCRLEDNIKMDIKVCSLNHMYLAQDTPMLGPCNYHNEPSVPLTISNCLSCTATIILSRNTTCL
jgi:hypothetical protein